MTGFADLTLWNQTLAKRCNTGIAACNIREAGIYAGFRNICDVRMVYDVLDGVFATLFKHTTHHFHATDRAEKRISFRLPQANRKFHENTQKFHVFLINLI